MGIQTEHICETSTQSKEQSIIIIVYYYCFFESGISEQQLWLSWNSLCGLGWQEAIATNTFTC